MKVLIDTNVIIDVIMEREPFLEDSAKVLDLCVFRGVGCIIASQTTDLFYILRRELKDSEKAKKALETIKENLTVLGVTEKDVDAALKSPIGDFEDALLVCCAERQKASFIITRNEKDFKRGSVPAISPSDFLKS